MIDLDQAIKCLPNKINSDNLHRCELFDFTNTRRSLISFINDQQDELFRYYDTKNVIRLTKIYNNAKDI